MWPEEAAQDRHWTPPGREQLCPRGTILTRQIPLGGERTGPWRDALAMLNAGFPRSQAELLDRYRVLSQSVTNGTCALQLQPRSAAARRMMAAVEIDFDTADDTLPGTELEFSDGSTLRNDFHDVVKKPKLEETMFEPPIPPGYTVVHPLEQK